MYNFNSFCAKSHLVCVYLILLRILCKKSRCFPGKFTQLAKILHDRWLWRSRQVSTLLGRWSSEAQWRWKHLKEAANSKFLVLLFGGLCAGKVVAWGAMERKIVTNFSKRLQSRGNRVVRGREEKKELALPLQKEAGLEIWISVQEMHEKTQECLYYLKSN